MTSVNVDLLVKDELIYELIWRGFGFKDIEGKDVTVAHLRKQLRNALVDKIPTDFEHLKILKVSDELQMCKRKLVEVERLIEVLSESEDPLHILRTKYRVEHLQNRVKNLLENSESLLSGERRSEVEKLLDNVNKFEVIISKKYNSELFKPGAGLNVVEESVETADTFLELEKREKPLRSLNTNTSQSTSQGHAKIETMLGDLSLFSKIPNPVESYIKEFPFTNGLDENKLLQFVKTMLKLKRVTQLTDQQILAISIPYTSDPLTSVIRQTSQTSLSHVHRQLLTYFIPRNRLESLRTEMVHRPQEFTEQFSMYISGIKEGSELLLCNLSESELVENIVLGMNPQERSRVTLLGTPRSFEDLEKMCIYSHNVQYIDHERNLRRGSYNQLRGRSNVNNISSRPSNNFRSNQNVTEELARACFGCGKVGHRIRECWHNPRGRGRGRGRGGWSDNHQKNE